MLRTCDKHLDEELFCPHCKVQLTCCNAPPFHVGDGLGWGSEILYICLNDDCPLFVNGWKHIEAQYAHKASYRYMQLPGEKEGNTIMVASKDAFKGSEVDRQSLKLRNERYTKEKEAVQMLDSCVAENNLEPVMTLLLDEAAVLEGRKRAAGLLVELNDLSCIDPLRNHTFKENGIEQSVNMSITRILAENYKKECPYCSEIVKQQAKICMYCNKDLS